MFVRKYIFITAMCLFGASAEAGQLYKIVDAKGNITYSQFPPGETPPKGKVEDVQVAGESQSAVTQRGVDQYCGNIRLPRNDRYASKKGYFAESLRQQQESWERSLTQEVESMDQRHRYEAARGKGMPSTDLTDLQQIRDYRCAINWAKEEINKTQGVVSARTGENERLQTVYAKVEEQLARSCGEKPELDPTDARNERLRSEWYTCSKPYLDNLRKLRGEMNGY